LVAIVAAQLVMRTRGETLKRRFHDVARRAEVIVMLHVAPGALAAERGASDDDRSNKRKRPPKGP
jgi:hypothetical protein